MLKFILVAFLFMGLAVNGAQEEEQSQVADNAVNMKKEVKNSESSAESSEEESSEESDYDSSASQMNAVVSEEDKNEFDQEDDFGSQVMEDAEKKEQAQEENQDDDSGARCWKPRCRGFLIARRRFYGWKRNCHRCLRRKYRGCKKWCTIYRRHAAHRYRFCRRWIYLRMKGWRAALALNWRRLVYANKKMWRNLNAYRWYMRRVRRYRYNQCVNRRNRAKAMNKQYMRQYRAHKKVAKKHNKRMWLFWNARKRLYRIRNKSKRVKYLIKRYTKAYRAYKKARNAHRRAAAYYLKKARQAWRVFRFYRTMVIYWNRAKMHKKKFAKWLRVKRYYVRQRRNFWIRSRKYKRRLYGYCMRTVRKQYWKCRLCNWQCGRGCWNMHHYYALAIVRAHMCRLQYVLCRRKNYYFGRMKAWGRACSICWHRTNNKLRLLICARRCNTFKKYKWVANYYNRKCKS